MEKQKGHRVSFAHLHIVCIRSKEEKHSEPACAVTTEGGSIFLILTSQDSMPCGGSTGYELRALKS